MTNTCQFCHASDTETRTQHFVIAAGSSTLCVDVRACGVRENAKRVADEARWAIEDEAQWAWEEAEQDAEDAREDAYNAALSLLY